jgi:hypothetical protein
VYAGCTVVAGTTGTIVVGTPAEKVEGDKAMKVESRRLRWAMLLVYV